MHPSVHTGLQMRAGARGRLADCLETRAAAVLISLARPIPPATPRLTEVERRQVDADLELYLVRQVLAMPRYMLAPLLVVLLGLDWLPMLTRGRPFRALPGAAATQIVAAWSRSRLSPKRDLIKLVRNCTLFFYLDHPIVRARLEEGLQATAHGTETGHGD